ncbi:hypothetical protein AQUCO_01700492v1 [Aquilegia coerulea]|uniref:Secreted protein n=1 Tax=Aquilegia coerulea TaxID=218851 RepID=A0A2G5DN52_AQUCA|nr:hypothetical protein AQUCO_01700492v1 [Aquilegia coerulea]
MQPVPLALWKPLSIQILVALIAQTSHMDIVSLVAACVPRMTKDNVHVASVVIFEKFSIKFSVGSRYNKGVCLISLLF